jgi:type I restriction enzyme M protein
MDPACGTGGFLTCTIEHKPQALRENGRGRAASCRPASTAWRRSRCRTCCASTNMILHGIEVPSQIRHDNTLARPLIGWGPKTAWT